MVGLDLGRRGRDERAVFRLFLMFLALLIRVLLVLLMLLVRRLGLMVMTAAVLTARMARPPRSPGRMELCRQRDARVVRRPRLAAHRGNSSVRRSGVMGVVLSRRGAALQGLEDIFHESSLTLVDMFGKS